MDRNRFSRILEKATLAPLHTRFQAYASCHLKANGLERPVSVLANAPLRENDEVKQVTGEITAMDCLEIVFHVCRKESSRDFFVFKQKPESYYDHFINKDWNFFFVTKKSAFVLMDGYWKEEGEEWVPKLTILVNRHEAENVCHLFHNREN